ncbi:hypothetical protein ES708_21577 [subsurface metagenome]
MNGNDVERGGADELAVRALELDVRLREVLAVAQHDLSVIFAVLNVEAEFLPAPVDGVRVQIARLRHLERLELRCRMRREWEYILAGFVINLPSTSE